MKYRYIGKCAAGFVKFGDVVLREREPTEVPEWLAKKLAHNTEFERVEEVAHTGPDAGAGGSKVPPAPTQPSPAQPAPAMTTAPPAASGPERTAAKK